MGKSLRKRDNVVEVGQSRREHERRQGAELPFGASLLEMDNKTRANQRRRQRKVSTIETVR